MRYLALDWGTTRLRAYRVADDAIVDRATSEDGIASLGPGLHAAAFERACGRWLAAEPDLRVVMVGMVGSREGWFPAPYVACPAGPAEIAGAMTEVDLGAGRSGLVAPGLIDDDGAGVDVMRGEETHLLGSGVRDGLVCLPGTHCKWAEMREGRIRRFATFMTGEMHALLREHSMIGRPAVEPSDPDGFARGLKDAGDGGGSLLNLLFRARAATVSGRLAPEALSPYLSGLLAGDEVAGALTLFGSPATVTVIADVARADLYGRALGARGIGVAVVSPERSLLRGIAALVAHRPGG